MREDMALRLEGAEVLLDATLDIRPRAWERTTGGRHTPEGLRNYQEELWFLIVKARNESGNIFRIEPEDKLFMSVVGYRRGNRDIDSDNFYKAIADAGQPTIWPNDSQFVGHEAWVFTGALKDRIEVKIWRLKQTGEESQESA